MPVQRPGLGLRHRSARPRRRCFKMVERPGRLRRPQDQLHLATMTATARRRRWSRSRRLIEQDKVAFLFNTLGTPTNSAIERYCNQKKVPQLFVAQRRRQMGQLQAVSRGRSAGSRATAPRRRSTPNTSLKQKPDAKIGDPLSERRFRQGLPRPASRDVLGKDWDKQVVKSVSYEITDADDRLADRRAAERRAPTC